MDDHTDDPAPPGETRDEVISRVNDEQQEIYAATGSTMARDVTSRRHLGTRGLIYGIGGAVVGGGVGALIGLFVFNVWIMAPLAVVGFVLAWLLTAERDDGAIARDVDANLGHPDSTDRPAR